LSPDSIATMPDTAVSESELPKQMPKGG
jgi:hypothetical protein